MNRAHRITNSLCLLFVVMSLMGCQDGGLVYSSVRDIPRSGWGRSEVCEFEFKIDRELPSSQLFVDLRSDSKYPWNNVFLEWEFLKKDSLLLVDTLECVLSDKSGVLLGRGSATIRENSFVLRQNMTFSDTGTYKVRIKHLMRNVSLKGINSLGVRIEQPNIKNKIVFKEYEKSKE